jgi:hypothetical protein
VTAGFLGAPFLAGDFLEETEVVGDFFLTEVFFLGVVPVCALAPQTSRSRAAISRDGKKRFMELSG